MKPLRSVNDLASDDFDYVLHFLVCHGGIQGDAYLPLVEILSHRAYSPFVAQLPVIGLPVDGDVMDLKAYVISSQHIEEIFPVQFISILQSNGI